MEEKGEGTKEKKGEGIKEGGRSIRLTWIYTYSIKVRNN